MLPSNVRLITTNWIPGNSISNLLKLLFVALPIVFFGSYNFVFYHMTDLHAAVWSPVVRLRQKKQFLWYAHTHRSRYLVFASKWVTNVITSTLGSCPISGNKVLVIGQAIDSSKFSPIQSSRLIPERLIHIGRFDKSKNVPLMIESVTKIKKAHPGVSLTLVGAPSNQVSERWAEEVRESSTQAVAQGWLRFQSSISRTEFPEVLSGYDCFFHAYQGSLDKTLIESTMLRVPVITINREYIAIFGSWAQSSEPNLEREYLAFRNLTPLEVSSELNRRLKIAQDHHSLTNWVSQLKSILS